MVRFSKWHLAKRDKDGLQYDSGHGPKNLYRRDQGFKMSILDCETSSTPVGFTQVGPRASRIILAHVDSMYT